MFPCKLLAGDGGGMQSCWNEPTLILQSYIYEIYVVILGYGGWVVSQPSLWKLSSDLVDHTPETSALTEQEALAPSASR